MWSNDAITVFKDEIEQDEAKKEQYPKSLIDLVAQHHTEEDNPILIFYEFKDSRVNEKN